MSEEKGTPPNYNGEATKKKKKTKLQKICELESSMKILREENKRLKNEIIRLKSSSLIVEDESIMSSDVPDRSQSLAGSTSTRDEKLKDAIRALKRVTVKQEMSLSTLRSKAKQRRTEIEKKDQVIERLQEELGSLKAAYRRMQGNSTNDVSSLKGRIVELELQLASEKANHQDQAKQLSRSKHDVTSLRGQLEKAHGRVQRTTSSRSMRSDTSSASEDIARMKRELANKTEQIANLEFELEEARDQIHEIRRNKQFDESFPAVPVPGMENDFFSDEETEDDYWGD